MTFQIGLLTLVVLLALAFGAGCWFYRYTLKRDPEKLEGWAKELKAAHEKAEALRKRVRDL